MTESPVDAQEVRRWRDRLLVAGLPTDEAAIIDALAELELVKSAACAAQARLSVTLDDVVRTREAAHGVAAARRGRGVAGQIALARQESPHRGRVLLGLARDLHTDLPHTLTALAEGRLNEERATVVAVETGCLDRPDRARIDADVCGNPQVLAGLGRRKLADELRRRVSRTDPAAVVRRARKAERERCVTIRPAPDTMAYVTALVPMPQGVAAYAALKRDADAAQLAGDPLGRTRSQLMADLFIERLTGQTAADAVPVCIDLVLSDETLLAAGHDPATIPAHGPVPAQLARELVARALNSDVPTWLRRLYADPSGHLVAQTSKQRFAPDGLADFVGLRDAGLCRTPWCDAPVRHVDHVESFADGGSTTADNTQGLCEQCNHTKQAPGWQQRPVAGDRHTVETVTPSGHRYRSRAPALPTPLRSARGRPVGSAVEISFARTLFAYNAA